MNRFTLGALLGAIVVLAGCGGSTTNSSGNTSRLYIADGTNNRIVRIDDMNGTGWTTFGSNGAGVNQFSDPTDIAFDSLGRIIIADYFNNRIVRINNMTGAGWVTFGTGGAGVNQFDNPYKVAVDSLDRIYIVDSNNDRIVRINDMAGTGWVSFGASGSGTNQFSDPIGVSLDGLGRIYVTDWGNDRVVRLNDMTGAGWTTFGTSGSGVGQFGSAVEIEVESNGTMLIVDRTGRVIRTSSMSQTSWVSFSDSSPQSATRDANGRIYVVDQNSDQLSRFQSMSGGIPLTFGSTGSGINQFDSPNSVTFGP